MGVCGHSVTPLFWVTQAVLMMCIVFITVYSGFRHEEKKILVILFTTLLVLLIRYVVYDVIMFLILAGDSALFPQHQRNFQDQSTPKSARTQFLHLKLRALKSILRINEKHRNELLNDAYRRISHDVWLYGKYYVILFLLVLVTQEELLYYNTRFAKHKLFINDSSTYGVSELQDFTEFKDYIELNLINTLNVPLASGVIGWSLGEQHKLLGVVRLRQMRLEHLHNGLSYPEFDTRDYMPEWTLPFQHFHYKDHYWRIYNPWIYDNKSHSNWAAILLYPDQRCVFNNYPNLNGYMTTLSTVQKNSDKILEFMADYDWITEYTAVIFIDLAMYNADANVFTVVSLHIEQTPFGSIYTSVNVDSVRLLQNFLNVTTLSIFILIVYILVLVQFTNALVIKLWFDRTALLDTWNRIDLTIILLNIFIWLCIVLREWMVMKLLRRIERSTKMDYLDFRVPTTLSNLLSIFIGFLVCVTTIRLWKVMQFGRVFQLFTKTLALAWTALTSSFVIIIINLIAIAIALCLINGDHSNGFNRVAKAVVTCMCFAFGYSSEIDPESLFYGGVILGFIAYAILAFVIVILLINTFVSLINDYFTEARSRATEHYGSITFFQFIRMEYNEYFIYKHWKCCRKGYVHNNFSVTENLNKLEEKKAEDEKRIGAQKYFDELAKKPPTETVKQTNYRIRLEHVQGVGDILTTQLELLHELLFPYEKSKMKTKHFNVRSRSVI